MTNINHYLDDKTITTLKSTVDFLADQGAVITGLFYQKLFVSHPELKNIFNLAHQDSGQQQQALANAVYGFAANLDNLDNLAEEISRITHKHASLNVQPEHYPIVGENLLAAIHETVSAAIDTPTADTMTDAWEKAYSVLAGLLINAEKNLYDQAESQVSGWRGLREFTLVKREVESQGITSFTIKPTDKKALPTYQAGQYVSVTVKAEDWEYQQIRQYSLSDSHKDDCYRFTVKKDGLVSSFLHDHWNIGDTIEITPPAGDFYLQSNTETPVVLIGAGVGVTPMISLLKSVLEKRQQQPIVFAHAVKNSEQHAFKAFMQETAITHADRVEKIVFYEEPLASDQPEQDYDYTGRMNLEPLQKTVYKRDANYYLCGPKPFMASIHKTLSGWGVNKTNIHYEVFGSNKSLY